MEKDKNLVITTGGFALYFFMGLIILSLVVFVRGVNELIDKNYFDMRLFFGLIVICWAIVYLIMYLKSNRIELLEDKLNIFAIDRTLFKPKLFPKVTKTAINLNDIEAITLGQAKYLHEVAQLHDDKDLKEELDKFKQIVWYPIKDLPVLPIFQRGLKYIPLVQIIKKQGKPFIFDTKPFSKMDVEKLVRVLQERGIAVNIQEGIL